MREGRSQLGADDSADAETVAVLKQQRQGSEGEQLTRQVNERRANGGMNS